MKYLFETDRLRFREFTPADAPALYELNADPEVIRYTGDPPFDSVEAALEFIRKYDAYSLTGMGRWAMELCLDGTFIGWCGLKQQEGEVDLGYRLHRRYWGHGYATEAAMACLEHGFSRLGHDSIIGRVMHQNIASRKVLEKCGMRYEKEIECQHHPAEQFRVLKTDFHPTKTYSFVPSQKQL